jgi:hypothetical protein
MKVNSTAPILPSTPGEVVGRILFTLVVFGSIQACNMIAERFGYAQWVGYVIVTGALWLNHIVHSFGDLEYTVAVRCLMGVSSLAGILLLGYRISQIRLDDWTVPNVFSHVLGMIMLVNLLLWVCVHADREHGKKGGKSWSLSDDLE